MQEERKTARGKGVVGVDLAGTVDSFLTVAPEPVYKAGIDARTGDVAEDRHGGREQGVVRGACAGGFLQRGNDWSAARSN
jgi:hypothetical protein